MEEKKKAKRRRNLKRNKADSIDATFFVYYININRTKIFADTLGIFHLYVFIC